VEEFITLADSRLSVFAEEGSMEMDVLELPQHKITDFTLVCALINWWHQDNYVVVAVCMTSTSIFVHSILV